MEAECDRTLAASRVARVITYVAGELRVAQGGALASTLLEAANEVREPLRGAGVPWNAERHDRLLDGIGLALDFHEVIHPGVMLETHGRAVQVVLPDVAIDLHRHDESKPLEDALQIFWITADV